MLAEASEIFSDKRRKRKQKNSEDKARLYEEIGRLKVELDWLKKNLGLTPEGKHNLVEPDNTELSITRQCDLLGLFRSGFYYTPKDTSLSAADSLH